MRGSERWRRSGCEESVCGGVCKLASVREGENQLFLWSTDEPHLYCNVHQCQREFSHLLYDGDLHPLRSGGAKVECGSSTEVEITLVHIWKLSLLLLSVTVWNLHPAQENKADFKRAAVITSFKLLFKFFSVGHNFRCPHAWPIIQTPLKPKFPKDNWDEQDTVQRFVRHISYTTHTLTELQQEQQTEEKQRCRDRK